VPKDLAGQAKLATASLAAALRELGASAQDIVMLRVYVVNATSEAFGQAVTPLAGERHIRIVGGIKGQIAEFAGHQRMSYTAWLALCAL